MSDGDKTPDQETRAVDSGRHPLRDNATWLIALLGSLAAAIVPFTEAVRGHYELRSKDEQFQHDLELRKQDLQSKIEIQFLTLVTNESIKAADKKRILDVLANYSSDQRSLQLWARAELKALASDIEEIEKLSNAGRDADKEQDPGRRALLVAQNKLEQKLHDLEAASLSGDREAVAHIARDELPLLREAVNKAEQVRIAQVETLPATKPAVPALAPGETLESKITPELVSRMFPGTPPANIQSNLPTILRALTDAGINDPTMALIALSTIRVEAPSFQPIQERESRFSTSPGGHPFDLYDSRKDLGNQGPPDGEQFKGRGYVQFTGRANYTRLSRELGLGDLLVNEPEKMVDPVIAARVLALLIKSKEQALKAAISADDLRLARRLITGGSNGLDQFVEAFRIGQKTLS